MTLLATWIIFGATAALSITSGVYIGVLIDRAMRRRGED